MAEGQLWESTLGGHFVLPKRTFWPSFFSKVVARLQWDPATIDLSADAQAWPTLPDERRNNLMTLLAGFRVAEDAVSEHIAPFADVARNANLASHESLMAWVFFLQRRDEDRHALMFDRIADEMRGLPGETRDERREAARAYVPATVLALFEERLPAMAADLAEGRAGLGEGVALYHMVLEGTIFDAAHHALRTYLADDDLPGVREGVERVELDERWHIGFGLRCLIEAQPSQDLLDDLLALADEAAAAWGEVLPDDTREHIATACRHRLVAVGLIEPRGAVEQAVARSAAAA